MDLFVYGTLMVPEVMFPVCGHRGRGQSATLNGYRRRRIADEVYPAMSLESFVATHLDAFVHDYRGFTALPVED